MKLDIPGYSDSKVIAYGLHCCVMQAVREGDLAKVILKFPKSESPSKKQIDILEHERTILTVLRDSSFVPKLYGMEKNGDIPFLIIERILSPSIAEIFTVTPKFSLEEFLPFALAAVQALESIHRHNIIHCDISESNLLYDFASKRCYILDFSLAAAIDRQKAIPRNPDLLEGTLATSLRSRQVA